MAGPEKKFYLFLDGVSSRDLYLAKLSESGRLVSKRRVNQGTRTEKFLPNLWPWLTQSPGIIKGIIVVQGSGSFSQVRLVCAWVNALAYGLKIPVAAVRGSFKANLSNIWPKLSWRRLLKPDYSGKAVG